MSPFNLTSKQSTFFPVRLLLLSSGCCPPTAIKKVPGSTTHSPFSVISAKSLAEMLIDTFFVSPASRHTFSIPRILTGVIVMAVYGISASSTTYIHWNVFIVVLAYLSVPIKLRSKEL